MRILFQIAVILCVLLCFGAAKLPFEDQLNQDMVDQQLIQPPLKEGTNLRLGQTSAAVALGGLRSLVASIWNLRAFLHFENLDWIKLEQSYEVITTLQPQTTDYWDTGAWHLHTNASVYYKENQDLSPIRRSAMQVKYIRKGSAFLTEGVTQNPDNWRLHLELARLWNDRHKLPDPSRALGHYQDALACASLPDYKRSQLRRFSFYVMVQVQGRERDAHALGLTLFKQSTRNHTPNLVSCLFALQNALDLPESERLTDAELFPNNQTQLLWLKNFWNHRHQDYPMDGVRRKINELELKIQPPHTTPVK
ncbi:MAG: hypothetical protein KJO21_10325 [Verrucomicrobiae bacterium]|nr:hypothetical protein [Verrucomicrobiae bacterium]NNJ42330.1 hypothetical protein [Akkermansiaceae bacterium]